MKQKFIIWLLDNNEKFIDEKEIFLNILDQAEITVDQRGFTEEYNIKGGKNE